MSEEQHQKFLEEVKTLITETIKVVVNGKIDKSNALATQAIETAKASAETAYHASLENVRMNREMTVQLQVLSDKISPVVEVYTDLNGTKKVLKYVFYTLSLIIGFILSLKALFPNLFHK